MTICELLDSYANNWQVFVAEEGVERCRMMFRFLARRAKLAGHRVVETYPDGEPIGILKSPANAMMALDNWCQKGRYFTIFGGGFFQPGDGVWVELRQSKYRGEDAHKVHVSDFQLEDLENGVSPTIAELILEALWQWEATCPSLTNSSS